MKKTGLVYDELFMMHSNGHQHPECPERLEHIHRMLNETGMINDMENLQPRDALPEEITAVHTNSHYEFIKSTKGKEYTKIDSDTSANAYSFDAAVRGSGGLINALEKIKNGELSNAFALPRPPGHHAESNRAMGFCLFNHAAVGAAYLLSSNFNRVMIIDWDVHHGNGTQEIFYSNPEVLYLSTHQFPFYPGTGSLNEIGKGNGRGFTINVPMPARMNDDDYISVFKDIAEPVIEQYKPEFLIISAGFDSYFLDPLGGMQVTEAGFSALTRFVMNSADKYCKGRLAFVLEGGYNLPALYSIMQSVFEELLEKKNTVNENFKPSPGCEMTIESVKETYSDYWKF